MGHIFQLGRLYADALDLKVLDENGKLVTVTMGSYGIGPSPGPWRRSPRAPSTTSVCAGRATCRPPTYTSSRPARTRRSSRRPSGSRTSSTAVGVQVLYDDRAGKISPGVKFKDAELIGVPTIVVVGKGLPDGVIEVKDRRTGERADVPADQVVDHLVGLVRS